MTLPGLQIYLQSRAIGRKRTQFLYLQLLGSSVPTPQLLCKCSEIHSLGIAKPKVDVQFPHLWFSILTTFVWPPDPHSERFMPLPVNHLCQLASKFVHLFPEYHVYKFGNRWTEWVENIMPPPVSLAWQRNRKNSSHSSFTHTQKLLSVRCY